MAVTTCQMLPDVCQLQQDWAYWQVAGLLLDIFGFSLVTLEVIVGHRSALLDLNIERSNKQVATLDEDIEARVRHRIAELRQRRTQAIEREIQSGAPSAEVAELKTKSARMNAWLRERQEINEEEIRRQVIAENEELTRERAERTPGDLRLRRIVLLIGVAAILSGFFLQLIGSWPCT